MAVGGSGELAVERWNADSLFLPPGNQLTPDVCDAGVEAENTAVHAFAEANEPRLQACLALARRQAFDALAKLPDGDGADVEFRLVVTQPRHDQGVRLHPGEFAKDVSIHQEAHRIRGQGFVGSPWLAGEPRKETDRLADDPPDHDSADARCGGA